jgi:hypothetical protein
MRLKRKSIRILGGIKHVDYRIYAVNAAGKFSGPTRTLTAGNDRQACEQVLTHSFDVSIWGVEIWEGDRLVVLTAIKSDDLAERVAPFHLKAGPDWGRADSKRHAEKKMATEPDTSGRT